MHYGGKHYHQQLFNQCIQSEVTVKNYKRMGTHTHRGLGQESQKNGDAHIERAQ